MDLSLPDGTPVGGYWLAVGGVGPALLFLHDADEIIADHVERWSRWGRELGLNVLLLDWPGFASSGGSPGLGACRAAARAALEFLLARDPAEVPQVLVYGRGLGSVFACESVRGERSPRLRGLVLESGVADLADWVAERVPWEQTHVRREDVMEELDAALSADFRVRATLEELDLPVLVLHGLGDARLPLDRNGERLAFWAGTVPCVLPEGDHESLLDANANKLCAALRAFVAKACPRDGESGGGP